MLEWLTTNKEWLFSGVGVAVATIVLSFIIRNHRRRTGRRENESGELNESSSRSSVAIGNGNVIGGHVAGRDVIINMNELKPRLEELVDILTDRARVIETDLSEHFRYAKVRTYLDRFRELHQVHIEALKKGNIAHAHEVLNEIHKISFELEKDEFWSRHAVESPGTAYSLGADAFQRGYMICAYVFGDMDSHSPRYPTSMVERLPLDHPLRDPLREYKIVLGESPPEPSREDVMAALRRRREETETR